MVPTVILLTPVEMALYPTDIESAWDAVELPPRAIALSAVEFA